MDKYLETLDSLWVEWEAGERCEVERADKWAVNGGSSPVLSPNPTTRHPIGLYRIPITYD